MGGGDLPSAVNRLQTRAAKETITRIAVNETSTLFPHDFYTSSQFLYTWKEHTNTWAKRKKITEEKLSRRFVYRLNQMPNDVCNKSHPKQGKAANRGAKRDKIATILSTTQSSQGIIHSPKHHSKITYRMGSCFLIFGDTLHQQKRDAMYLCILHKS